VNKSLSKNLSILKNNKRKLEKKRVIYLSNNIKKEIENNTKKRRKNKGFRQ
jgi:hypothetical protein